MAAEGVGLAQASPDESQECSLNNLSAGRASTVPKNSEFVRFCTSQYPPYRYNGQNRTFVCALESLRVVKADVRVVKL